MACVVWKCGVLGDEVFETFYRRSEIEKCKKNGTQQIKKWDLHIVVYITTHAAAAK